MGTCQVTGAAQPASSEAAAGAPAQARLAGNLGLSMLQRGLPGDLLDFPNKLTNSQSSASKISFQKKMFPIL